MKKLLVSFVLGAFAVAPVAAQDANLEKINEMMVKKQYAEADSLMRLTLASPKTKSLQQAYNKAGLIQLVRLNEEANKQGQGIPFDTLGFIAYIDNAIDYYTKSYQATVTPNEKGKLPKVDKVLEADTKLRLMSTLAYPTFSAMFMLDRKDTLGAIKYFKKFLDATDNPAFTQVEKDSLNEQYKETMIKTRYNVCFLEYGRKNWSEVIRLADQGIADGYEVKNLYFMKRDAYQALGDTKNWAKTLQEASAATGDPSFAEQLLSVYLKDGQTNEAKSMVADMMAKEPNSALPWFLKGLLDGQEESAGDDLDSRIKPLLESRKSYEKALELDPSFARAHVNLGVTYWGELIERMNVTSDFNFLKADRVAQTEAYLKEYRNQLNKALPFYEKAQSEFETAKALDPQLTSECNQRLTYIYKNLRTYYESLNEQEKVGYYDGLLNMIENE